MRMNPRIEGLPRMFGRRKRRVAYLLFALSMAVALPSARGQSDERSGKEVVDKVCIACHGTGANGAPKIGDNEAWANRASLGLSSLTLHALQGIRNMPAHGGDPALGDLEIARAVTYMVNQSGGSWIEPASANELAAELTGEQVVKAQCSKCHAEGIGGAPKIGDLPAWVQRLKLGIPYLLRSAIHGHGGMPPRGGLANLTDAEIRSAILYMFNPAGMPAKASSAAPPVRPDPNRKHVDGIEVYLGFMPAENIRALPEGSPERIMHGGVPQGPGYYHVNVSLYDAKSRAPINDAHIQMQFARPGLDSTSIKLQPMSIGVGGSYGNYVKPQPGTSYAITLNIHRPGASDSVEAKFQHAFE